MRPLCRSSVKASSKPSRVGSARTRSPIVKRGATICATGRGGWWMCGSAGSRSSSAWYTSTPASSSRMIRRTSSRETWRHDSRMRPHFGHFTIHSSRSFFPILIPPRHLGQSRPNRRAAQRFAELFKHRRADRGGISRRKRLPREFGYREPRVPPVFPGPDAMPEIGSPVATLPRHEGNSRAICTARSKLWAETSSIFTPSGTGGRDRLCFEEDLGREEITSCARLLDETIDLVIAFRDRDVPEGDVVSPLRERPKDPVRLDDRRPGIADATAIPSDQDEVSEPVVFDGFADPTSKDRLRRDVSDDLVHDRIDPEVPQQRREVARIQIAVERLARMVLLEDLRDVHSVQVLERADRVTDPLDECVHRFLAHPPPRRDDFKDDGGGRKRLAEWPTHAGPHGHADILERSPSPAAPLFVSLRRNEKHNVLPAIVRIEAKGWAIEFGGGPSRSCSTTSPCATRRSTNSRRSAKGWAWR